MVRLGLLLFVSALLTLTARGATHNAASVSYADVNAKVTLAADGDTINVPAGTATWSSGINTTKAISIIGAGIGSTIINNSAGTVFRFSGQGSNPVRLSGMRINGSDNQNPVHFVGPVLAFRVDHIYFNKGDSAITGNGLGQNAPGAVWGVVDHCVFLNMKRPHFSMDTRSGDSIWGLGAWNSWRADDGNSIVGTEKAIYFEDNTFEWNNSLTDFFAQGALYGGYGGKCVFRFNVCTNFPIFVDMHGDTPEYGGILYEIYGNRFDEGYPTGTSPDGKLMWQRGGSWLVYSNDFRKIGGGSPSLPMRMSVYWESDIHRVTNTYVWANTINGAAVAQTSIAQVQDSGQTSAGYSATHIVLGTHYKTNSPQSGEKYFGYVPYTYPHPLVTGVEGNPGTFALTSSTYSAAEGTATVTITATRSGGSSGAVDLPYATSNGSATAGSDYTAASGNLSWTDGDTASKSFNVTIADDGDSESAETFTVTLSSPTGGGALGSPSSATVTITDNDVGAIPTLDYPTWQAEDMLIEAPFTATATNISQSVTTTDPAQGGRARAKIVIPDTGYYRMKGSVKAEGDGSNSVFVDWNREPVSPTAIWDVSPVTSGWETRYISWRGNGGASPQFATNRWYLTAGTHTNYVRGREAGMVLNFFTLEPDTSGQEVSFDGPGSQVMENGESVTLYVYRYPDANGTVSVQYATSDGNAVAGVNYTATSGTLTFTGGQSLKTISVPITNNGTYEANKNFSVNLSSPVGCSLLSPSSITVTILEDDRAGTKLRNAKLRNARVP